VGVLGLPAADPFASDFFAAPGVNPSTDTNTSLFASGGSLGSERISIAADFFYGGGQGTLVPPLVLLAPAGSTAGAATGFGAANTSVQFGNRALLKNLRPGFRVSIGGWVDRDSRLGAEVNAMALSDLSESYMTNAAIGGPVIARPVVNGLTNTNIGVPLGTTLPASIQAQVDTAYWGADANVKFKLRSFSIGRLDVLAGYRYAQLGDQLFVTTSQAQQLGLLVTGNAVGIQFTGGTPQTDFFRTTNQFHGGQVGLAGTVRLLDRVSISGRGTVALGATVSETLITGSATQPGGTGLLVQSTNAGTYREDYFSVMPELIGKIGFEPTDRLRLNLGYAWTYWSKVRRAADQVDLTVLAPGRPRVPNDTTDYWIQGWSLGLEWQW
jgi:hypothetical protein